MDRPKGLEDVRYVGDKRRQVVYDLDGHVDPAAIDELVAAGAAAIMTFGPDTLPEARNRGYRPARGGPSATG